MNTTLTGRCLCGDVKFTAEGPPAMMGHCHCEDCRRSSGTGHCSHMLVPEAGFTLSGRTAMFAKPSDSGSLVERHFCPRCGSPTHSKNPAMAGMIALRASALDDPEAFSPQMRVYTGRAPRWDLVDDGLPAFEKMPPGMP